ncbi:hypothetical protein E2C01_024210 [Portunus trituberculatus]|uniref:Uncharacterized protein n=1 Tax=Portunus trituberculatus TaxID=210409 RepID=A0A5B7EBH0_PORTR|nr:hypothetical protein [Portunus trituberculatus]
MTGGNWPGRGLEECHTASPAAGGGQARGWGWTGEGEHMEELPPNVPFLVEAARGRALRHRSKPTLSETRGAAAATTGPTLLPSPQPPPHPSPSPPLYLSDLRPFPSLPPPTLPLPYLSRIWS